MIVELPPAVARQISHNNGVVVTTDPFTFYSAIPASKLDRFKRVVDSVAEFSKAPNSKPEQKTQKAKVTTPGLPITEVFDDASGTTTLETTITPVSGNFQIGALALTAEQGKRLKQPFTALLVANHGAYPIWTNVDSVTLSFGTKKLRLTPNARKSGQPQNGVTVEVMTVRVPYKDFLALAKLGKCYVTVGDATFEVNSWKASGIRELARRISR